jgi:hypothetical protein
MRRSDMSRQVLMAALYCAPLTYAASRAHTLEHIRLELAESAYGGLIILITLAWVGASLVGTRGSRLVLASACGVLGTLAHATFNSACLAAVVQVTCAFPLFALAMTSATSTRVTPEPRLSRAFITLVALTVVVLGRVEFWPGAPLVSIWYGNTMAVVVVAMHVRSHPSMEGRILLWVSWFLAAMADYAVSLAQSSVSRPTQQEYIPPLFFDRMDCVGMWASAVPRVSLIVFAGALSVWAAVRRAEKVEASIERYNPL